MEVQHNFHLLAMQIFIGNLMQFTDFVNLIQQRYVHNNNMNRCILCTLHKPGFLMPAGHMCIYIYFYII